MSTLGRFFEFQVSPIPDHRVGGFKTGDSPIPQGAPVILPAGDLVVDPIDRLKVVELAAANAAPKLGESGLCVYEQPHPNIQLDVAPITRTSDFINAPRRSAIQVVHGTEVEVIFTNATADDLLFEGLGEYAGRNMVNPTDLAALVGREYLTPGAGNDTDGYWKVTATPSEGWLRVIDFDKTAKIVVATQLF